MGKKVLVFDLDDTLYKEVDFLRSAFHEIAHFISKKINSRLELVYGQLLTFYERGLNAFEEIISLYDLQNHVQISELLVLYRNHIPQIELSSENKKLLDRLKMRVYKIGLITDGRSLQQRNKIESLKLDKYFDDYIISEEFGTEKPNIKNFEFYMRKYGNASHFIYIGDNTNKDFIGPNKLGWTTICLKDNGLNIHNQMFGLENSKMPNYVINNLEDIENIIL